MLPPQPTTTRTELEDSEDGQYSSEYEGEMDIDEQISGFYGKFKFN
jgi:hypothetical protein